MFLIFISYFSNINLYYILYTIIETVTVQLDKIRDRMIILQKNSIKIT